MSPEKHLAAILAAWHETDGYSISFEMSEALEIAEKDFDGVEAEFNLNEFAYRREVMPIDEVTVVGPQVNYQLDGVEVDNDGIRSVEPYVLPEYLQHYTGIYQNKETAHDRPRQDPAGSGGRIQGSLGGREEHNLAWNRGAWD